MVASTGAGNYGNAPGLEGDNSGLGGEGEGSFGREVKVKRARRESGGSKVHQLIKVR